MNLDMCDPRLWSSILATLALLWAFSRGRPEALWRTALPPRLVAGYAVPMCINSSQSLQPTCRPRRAGCEWGEHHLSACFPEKVGPDVTVGGHVFTFTAVGLESGTVDPASPVVHVAFAAHFSRNITLSTLPGSPVKHRLFEIAGAFDDCTT